MCGIVGITSAQSDAVRSVIDRLAIMEYRGYDSHGIATVVGNALVVSKDVGSVSEAAAAGRFAEMAFGPLAIGHTRWATHGGVTRSNAHPHVSFDGAVAVAHNGVITNHAELRRDLVALGITFASQTDSEVIAHLVARELAEGESMLDSVCLATSRLGGEYAIVILSIVEPEVIYGIRARSPLVACGNGTLSVVASDQLAIRDLTDAQLLFLEDGDVARITADSMNVFTTDAAGRPVPARRCGSAVRRCADKVTKGAFPHFMIKEIYDIPHALEATLDIAEEELDRVATTGSPRPMIFVGAGSGFYVGQIAQCLMTELAGTLTVALPADEVDTFVRFQSGDHVVAISQSGETFDTLNACRLALGHGAAVTSISNVADSTLERLATHRLRQGAGTEISVLSTKSVVTQTVLLARLALVLGRRNGTISCERYDAHLSSLARLPHTIRSTLDELGEAIAGVARRHKDVMNWFFVGRGSLFPVAMESALKFKESSYCHAEGMSAGFFKHGTLSLISPALTTVALLPSSTSSRDRYLATLANVSEIVARGGTVIGIGPATIDSADPAVFADYVPLPQHDDDVADVVLALIAGQLLAYHVARGLGRPIDRPRHLAKSVTVR